MEKTFEAIYEHGVLRPLQDPGLTDEQHVRVTITDLNEDEDEIAAYFNPEEWALAKHDDITLEEVQRALSSIRGSLSDAVIASREER